MFAPLTADTWLRKAPLVIGKVPLIIFLKSVGKEIRDDQHAFCKFSVSFLDPRRP
jgi:hypothetical protein